MKKKIILSVILVGILVAAIIFFGKTGKNAPADNSSKADIVITDNYFIEATNDIYFNVDDYVGKTIFMEGYIYVYSDDEGVEHYAVVRNTPGCCGNDGLAGLDVSSENGYPEAGSWVEVTGELKKDKINGYDTPVIYLTDMKQKEEGQSFVTN